MKPSVVPSCLSGLIAAPLLWLAAPPSSAQLAAPDGQADTPPETSTAAALLLAPAPALVSEASGRVHPPAPTEALTQDPGILFPPAGVPPSLQLEPPTPDAEPFEPQQIPPPPGFTTPAITILRPTGYGRSWGQANVGIGVQSRTRFTEDADGVLGAGVGFGNARTAVGLDVGVIVYDITDFSRGGVSFKLHRHLPEDVAIAAGVFNVITWGDVDGGISPYGAVTKRFQTRKSVRSPLSQVYVTAGVGSGLFRSDDDIFNDVNTVGVYGSVAVRVVEPVNFIAEWSGQDLSLGVSFAPFRRIPLVFTPAVSDVAGLAGDGPRFLFGIGYGISY